MYTYVPTLHIRKQTINQNAYQYTRVQDRNTGMALTAYLMSRLLFLLHAFISFHFLSCLCVCYYICLYFGKAAFHGCPIKCLSLSLSLSLSHLHPGPISSGSGSKDFSLTSIHVLSQPNPGPYSHITPPSRQCLNSIQVLIFMCHLNQVTSHLHPGVKMYGASLSMPCLTSNQAIHQGCVSPQPMSWYLHLTTIQVTYHIHQGLEICISAPSRSYLKAIQVSRCVSHIHSGPVSDVSKLQNSCLTSIQVPPSLHPSPYIHISPPSRC